MIALYRGTSSISRLIRFRTWSPYSHASWVKDDGSVIEAWTDGVCLRESFDAGHTPGTRIDLFDVELTPEQKAKVEEFLTAQIGKKYDFKGIFNFIVRHEGDDQDRWFCSELIIAAFAYAGVPLLLRIPNYKVYPGLLAYSPRMKYKGITCTSMFPTYHNFHMLCEVIS